jgi:uncharacterized protein
MGFSLLPKEYVFFDMFDNLAEHCVQASKQLQYNIENNCFDEENVKKIKTIEKAADRIVYEIVEKLNKTFITPFDREDIHSLAHELDSVIDGILKLANHILIYKATGTNMKFLKGADLIDKSIAALTNAVKGLRNMKDMKSIQNYCEEVNRLEDEGDQLRNEAIGELFGGNNDAIYILKWRDVFLTAEKILDQCDDVSKIIETIIVKQA